MFRWIGTIILIRRLRKSGAAISIVSQGAVDPRHRFAAVELRWHGRDSLAKAQAAELDLRHMLEK